jgi:cell wall-associated NlpC family hydrolase
MNFVSITLRAIGGVTLLGAAVAGCGNASQASAQTFMKDGSLAAKVMAPLPASATGGAGANLVNTGDRAMCIDADSNHYPANGDNIQLWACNTHPEQEWVLTSAGQLKNASTSMCIDADSNHYPANGDNIQLWACNTHPEQEWAHGSGASETKAEAAAVQWARSMIGSASGTSGGQYWYGCLAFAINAYALGAGYPIRNDITVAVGTNTYPSQVWGNFRTGSTGHDNSPPPGALVFWDSTGGTTDSHVAISVGGGEVVSTNVDQPSVPGYDGIHLETMAQFSSNSWNIYKGWWLPDQ